MLVCLTGAAKANFSCGTALGRCRVQIDNAGSVWFESNEKLTEDALGDGTFATGTFQIYERTGGKTLLVSKLPDGSPIPVENRRHISAELLAVSPDGRRVYLSTDASLTLDDGDGGHEDGSVDLYELFDGRYTFLSTGPLDDQKPPPFLGGLGRMMGSDDGQYFYFSTTQRLVPEDLDNTMDIYQRHEGQVHLVSTGPDETLPTAEFPDPRFPAELLGISPDGATVYFITFDHLTADDSVDNTVDIYSWHDGTTTRLTRTTSPSEIFGSISFAVGPDGSAYFTPRLPQVPEDTDQLADIYKASPDGTIERLSATPPGTPLGGPVGGIFYIEAASRDGSRLLMRTTRALVPSDHNEREDLYIWSGGRFQRITPEPAKEPKNPELEACAMSGDGRRVYFDIRDQFSGQDTDNRTDVYEWSEGSVRLVSPASDGTPTNAFCDGISPNGRYVAFSTSEELTQEDGDTKDDIYLIDMEGSGGGVVGAASAARPIPSHHRHRLRLVTAESIPPHMRIGARGALGKETASLRLVCPKSEQSGPCHGRARLLDPATKRPLASGTFKIPSGTAEVVVLRGRGILRGSRQALARVAGADRLGNRKVITRTIALRRRAG